MSQATRTPRRRRHRLLRDVSTPTFVGALAVLILSGWASDILQDLFVARWAARYPLAIAAAVVAALAGASWALLRAKAARLSVRSRMEEEARPRQGLVMLLSTPGPVPEVEEDRMIIGGVVLSRGDIDDALDRLRDGGVRWNWQQLVRGLKPHLHSVRAVYLIGTAGEDGSYQYLDRAAHLVRLFREDIRVEAGPRLEDAFSFEQTLAALMHGIQWLNGLQIPEAQIAVDVTGGPKISSIAGAAATLKSSATIQYVETGPSTGSEPRVLHYDLLSEPEADL